MKYRSLSYEFNTQEVLDACVLYIDRRQIRIDNEREKMIQQLLTKPKRRYQFWRTKHTRESAIKYLKENGNMYITYWSQPTWQGLRWFNICEDLFRTLGGYQSDLVIAKDNTIILHDEIATFIGKQIFNMKHQTESKNARLLH